MQPDFLSVFISWFPMLLLVGVWIYFMRNIRGGEYQRTYAELMKRQVEALERIATALESKRG